MLESFNRAEKNSDYSRTREPQTNEIKGPAA